MGKRKRSFTALLMVTRITDLFFDMFENCYDTVYFNFCAKSCVFRSVALTTLRCSIKKYDKTL